MQSGFPPPLDARPSTESLAFHVLHLLASESDGPRLTLEDVSRRIGARRSEVRAMLTALHHQGLVDVLRMRPTLDGFAIGRALEGKALPALRKPRLAAVRAA